MDIGTYVRLFNKPFEVIKSEFSEDFTQLYEQEKEWLDNLENKTHLIKNKTDEQKIKQVIKILKSDNPFVFEDTDILSLFIRQINRIILITNRINNFKEGAKLKDGTNLHLFKLFNSIKTSSSYSELKIILNSNLNNFLPHLYSVIKHCQDPNQYPIYYKYWKNILREVLSKPDDYDSMCEFYRGFPKDKKQLNFATYLGTIGIGIAKQINKYSLSIKKSSKEYKYLTTKVINIERYNSILDEVIIKTTKNSTINMKEEFEQYLISLNIKGSNKVSSYIRAIELLDIILKDESTGILNNYNSIYNITDSSIIQELYEFVIKEQKNNDGIFRDKEPVSYWKNYFYSASLKSYLSFSEELKTLNNNYTLKKPLSNDILLAFKKWNNSSNHTDYEDFYKNVIDLKNIKNKSDNELIEFFVQFKKDGGNIQSTDNRTIDKFKKVISNSTSSFRDFVLEPFSPNFDELKWLIDLKKIKHFGIGTATIYLNRVDKNKYHPFNNKARDAFNLISSKKLPASETTAYSIVGELSKQMIDLYDCFSNYFQTDAFTQFIIGEEEGKLLIQKWLDNDIVDNDLFSINDFSRDLENSGLLYSQKTITRYISSLATKPFVILSGLSGSGKTKLAQAFAQWISEDKSQYCIVPVGADWINREPILGYVNALKDKEYILPENGALKLIIEANKPKNKNKPYFLILDEMNLSHVERYFADFLSVMETKDEKFKLHSSGSSLISQDGTDIESGYYWTKNLFVVGTVNIDETTYMFSPKVLDRANVIEFRINETEIGEYLDNSTELDMKKLLKEDSDQGLGASMGESFVSITRNKQKANSDNLKETLKSFFIELQKVGAEFGYRTASEIQTLFAQIDVVNSSFSGKENEKIDIAIMQKLLPKLHGSRNKLTDVLKTLATLCYFNNDKFTTDQKDKVFEILKEDSRNIQYPISLEKITRMYHNVISNGFTSYAEA